MPASHVQSQLLVSSGGPNPSLVLPSFTKQAATNFIVYVFRYFDNVGNKSITGVVSDTGATFSFGAYFRDANSNNSLEIWTSSNFPAAATIVTATWNTPTSFAYVSNSQYSGVPANVSVVSSASGNTVAGNSVTTTTSLAAPANNTLIFIAATQNGSVTVSSYSGLFASSTTRLNNQVNVQGDLIGGTGTATGTVTFSVGAPYTVLAVAIAPGPSNQPDAAQPQANIGSPFTMTAGTAYALPAKRVLASIITTSGTLQISMDNATWQTITLDSNRNAYIVAAFMRVTGDTAVANLKHTTKKNK